MPGQATVLNPKAITEVLKLLDSPRDKTIFAVGIYTGMRISEILSLEQDQIFTADGGVKYTLTVKRLKKKNTVYSDIPVHPKLRAQLKKYKENVKSHQYLSPSTQSVSGYISRARAHQILRSAYSSLNLQVQKLTACVERSSSVCPAPASRCVPSGKCLVIPTSASSRII
jgi:Phage integrase family.